MSENATTTPTAAGNETVKGYGPIEAAATKIAQAVQAWKAAGGTEPPPAEILSALQEGASALSDQIGAYAAPAVPEAAADEELKAMTADEILAHVSAEIGKVAVFTTARAKARLRTLKALVAFAKAYQWEDTERVNVPVMKDPAQLVSEKVAAPRPQAAGSVTFGKAAPASTTAGAAAPGVDVVPAAGVARVLADDQWPDDMADPKFVEGNRAVATPTWGFDSTKA